MHGRSQKAADLKVGETWEPQAPAHRMPPANAYGTNPDPNVGGAANGPTAWDVLPTAFQDNDPIRRTCIGNSTGNTLSEAEEVCNIDGKLGVVLAIPSSDFLPTTAHSPGAVPSNKCLGTYYEGLAPNLLSCVSKGTTTHAGRAPQRRRSLRRQPVRDAGRRRHVERDLAVSESQVADGGTTAPARIFLRRDLLTDSVLALDARVHNLFMFDGTVVGQQPVLISETIQNGKATPPSVDFAGGMGRINTVASIRTSVPRPTSAASSPTRPIRSTASSSRTRAASGMQVTAARPSASARTGRAPS